MDERKRTTRRICFTKAIRTVNSLIDGGKSTTVDVKTAFEGLAIRYQELEEISNKILEDMYAVEDITEEALETAADANIHYESEFLATKYKYEQWIAAKDEKASSVNSNKIAASKAPYNLPKVELVKFNGDIREWLRFWSLFSKIHEDSELRDEDKFQYLVQSMVPGSRAADLVNSYPPIGANYEKAVESLTKRFGREDLQIEVYVRELLQLVLENATGKRNVILAKLYDKIESYIRALETLGVTTDKCAAMLYPLVESALPEELLRVWQRSNSVTENNYVGKMSDMSKVRLERLISFLESEVQNELRISMAVKGFDIRQGERREREKITEKTVPTVRNLLNEKGEKDMCIFCSKSNHASYRCYKAMKMTSAEKQKIAQTERACFRCLEKGHLKRKCKSKINCSKCSGKHVEIMCFGKDDRIKSRSSSESSESAVNIPKECALASSSEIPATFMQTLKVRVRSDHKDIVIRALIDTGSQNSYVVNELAEKLNYNPVGQQDMVHLLFGGSKSNVATHQQFKVRVGNLEGTYWCNFDVLGEKVICADVPCCKKGPWHEELEKQGISLSDVDGKEKFVSLLIGADIAGKLLTGRVHQLKNGLTAIQTLLGWTLIGKVPINRSKLVNEDNLAISTISMYTKDVDLKDLWSLDVIGIKDPIEHKTKQQHNIQVEEMFKQHIVKNQTGRYEVKLPFLECHPELNNNRSMAVQRLEKAVIKPKQTQKFPRIRRNISRMVTRGNNRAGTGRRDEQLGCLFTTPPSFQRKFNYQDPARLRCVSRKSVIEQLLRKRTESNRGGGEHFITISRR